MKKPYYYLFALTSVIGCAKNSSKETKPPIDNTIKMEVIGGNNQIDTTGNNLKDSIQIKITKSGESVSGQYVQFNSLVCDGQAIEERQSGTNGIITYRWRLNNKPGTQFLKVRLLDGKKAQIDSLVITANAIKTSRGWMPSSCTPSGASPSSLIKLKGGKIFATFTNTPDVYYSDDNGQVFHKQKSNVNFIQAYNLLNTASDELFVLDGNTNLYYSKDFGKTWELRNPATKQLRISVLELTKSGKLIASVDDDGGKIYTQYSLDKGITWLPITGIPGSNYLQFCELNNGDLYFLTNNGMLQLLSKGSTTPIYPLGMYARVAAIGLDDTGNLYVSRDKTPNQQVVLKSTDNGKTFSEVTSGWQLYAYFKQQSDGSMYTLLLSGGIFKIKAPNELVRVIPDDVPGSQFYVLANDGNIVCSSRNSLTTSHLIYTVK